MPRLLLCVALALSLGLPGTLFISVAGSADYDVDAERVREGARARWPHALRGRGIRHRRPSHRKLCAGRRQRRDGHHDRRRRVRVHRGHRRGRGGRLVRRPPTPSSARSSACCTCGPMAPVTRAGRRPSFDRGPSGGSGRGRRPTLRWRRVPDGERLVEARPGGARCRRAARCCHGTRDWSASRIRRMRRSHRRCSRWPPAPGRLYVHGLFDVRRRRCRVPGSRCSTRRGRRAAWRT